MLYGYLDIIWRTSLYWRAVNETTGAFQNFTNDGNSVFQLHFLWGINDVTTI